MRNVISLLLAVIGSAIPLSAFACGQLLLDEEYYPHSTWWDSIEGYADAFLNSSVTGVAFLFLIVALLVFVAFHLVKLTHLLQGNGKKK